MEEQIKSIIHSKLHDVDFENNTDEKELELLTKLCEIFPELKNNNEKDNANVANVANMANITNGISNNDEIVLDEIVLDEIIINGEIYYKDKYGGIWNDNIELVGTVNNKNNCENYVLFNTYYNVDNDINKFI